MAHSLYLQQVLELNRCVKLSGVAVGKPLAYLNSLMQLSFALNQGSMAEKFNIGSGPDWTVEITWGDYLN
ncbi:MAG: hypothetical protein EBS04_06720 [Chitinophagia bacterium]|nr:hypothetical protein [Chitinophagia bacterium]